MSGGPTMTSRSILRFAVLPVALSVAVVLLAEPLCTLTVRVTDPDGHLLAGATVTIRGAGGFSATLPGEGGIARFRVPPGQYTVQVEFDGVRAADVTTTVGPDMWDPVIVQMAPRAGAMALPAPAPPSAPMPVAAPTAAMGPSPGPPRPDRPTGGYATIRVHYATDRAYTGEVEPAKLFGSARGRLHYGEAAVSIPRDHRMGVLEAPSVLRLEFREDPEHHVVLLDVTPQRDADFFERLRLAVRRSASREAMLFIHG